jgi:general secretion pathway protein E
LVASSLEAVIAQRLMRLICPHCKEQLTATEVRPLAERFGESLPGWLYQGRGCRRCQGTGYLGRVGIFEIMIVTDEIRSLILKNVSARDLRKVASQQGMLSLREDGFRHLSEGRTTVEEVLRVTTDERFKENGVYEKTK